MEKTMKYVVALLMILFPVIAQAADDVLSLQRELEAQAAQIRSQQKQLDEQAQKLEHMDQRMNEVAGGAAAPQSTAAGSKAEAAGAQHDVRDPVGDMNAEAVRRGEFPGSFRVPGPKNISLAIGGFVKTVAIFDSNAEGVGTQFMPAMLSNDGSGAFSIDSTLTRIFIDGRAPVPDGSVRGYVEYDLNGTNNGSPDFKLRHAYGAWSSGRGTLTAGHTWSTLMDLKILPEGLTEPTVSGVIFARQSMVRWSQAVGEGFAYHVALEDPSNNDVFSAPSATSPVRPITSAPDLVLGLEYAAAGIWHVRIGGIARRLEVTSPDAGDRSTTAAGGTMTGRVNLFGKDRLVLSGVYGKGLGRYLLGIEPTSGSTFDPVQAVIELRTNAGGMASYQHFWTGTLRSTVMTGAARSRPQYGLPGSSFDRSTYSAINLMWSVRPLVTIGIEYAYGTKDTTDNAKLDNQRIAFGIQFF